jgi:putative glutamine amidotransferase
MPPVRIGITSPLVAGEEPTADMGAAQHRAILERLGVTAVLLRNDEDPLTVIDRFALNGVIFSGGEEDIAPERYGGDAHLTHEADLRRDAFEFALMECMLRSNLPIFAVCRGMQIVNVCLDGTLIEDLHLRRESGPHVIHDQVSEANLPYSAYMHAITIVPGALLYDIVGADRVPARGV